ncbi:MAG: plasmid stabilization protein [Rhodoferax sp.]|nr:plasmid stabilization protein [Rhodoferax sp.]
MSTTLTIRNLEEPVKHLLRMQAASHKRSMEAEARDILTRAVTQATPDNSIAAVSANEAAIRALNAVRGKWQGRGSTDEMMQELRGED